MTEEHTAVVRKTPALDSESQWRLWEERKPQDRMWRTLAWESNTGIQKPGWPPTSHMTQSPSCARLPSRSLFTSGNCGTTKRAIKAQSTLKPTLNKCKLWSFLRYKSPGKRLALFLMAEAGFTKGLESSVLLTGHHGRTSFQKTHL